MIHSIKISNGNRDDVLTYIRHQKAANPSYRVIDVGGSMNGWSRSVVDAIADFGPPPLNGSSASGAIRWFQMDITHPDSWKEIEEYVQKEGKFDFCICTHTLEDIMNPGYVCEKISSIAKSGYIAVPSKHRELSRCEGTYKGYIHHRWIFNIQGGKFVGYPKINYIDSTNAFDSIASTDMSKYDLSFYWDESISVTYINGNFLGPDVASVKAYYNGLLHS